MNLREGEVVAGRYQIEKALGSGGTGRVYRAIDLRTKTAVAVKLVQLAGTEPAFRRRIEREVRVLQQLDHPNVVRCMDSGPLGEQRLYLVLEWLEGSDLSIYATRTQFSMRSVLEVLRQTAAALDAVHANEIIHRDVKPANLFVVQPERSPRLDCRLLDFGVAKVGVETTRLTRAGAILGTPCYMAPEQANRAMHVDGRADLFSLGVVAFELLTSKLPWQSKSDLARLANILTEEARPVRELAPRVPVEVANLVDQLLLSSIDDRVSTAAEVRDLSAALLEVLSPAELRTVHSKVEGVGALTRKPTWDVASEQTRDLESLASEKTPVRFDSEATRELQEAQFEASFAVGSEPTFEVSALEPDSLLPSKSGPTAMEGDDQLPQVGGLGMDGSSPWHVATDGAIADDDFPPVEPGTEYASLPSGQGPVGLADGPTEFFHPNAQPPLEESETLFDNEELGPLVRKIKDAASTINEAQAPAAFQTYNPPAESEHPKFDGMDVSALPPEDEGPIVGRQVAMQRLHERVARAFEQRRPSLSAVVGAAGRGKTSIRLAFHEELRGRMPEAAMFAGRAEEAYAVVPYAYIKRILCSLAGISSGSSDAKVKESIGALLPIADFAMASHESEVVGVLGGNRTRVTGIEEAEQRRSAALAFVSRALRLPTAESPALQAAEKEPQLLAKELDSALETALAKVAERKGLVLLVDDAHEIDLASARVIARVLRRSSLRLAVIALTLPSGLDKNRRNPLFKPGAVDVERINLLPLDRTSARQLALRLAGGAVESAALSAIVELSKGQPLFLAQLVQACLETKLLVKPAQSVRLELAPGANVASLPATVSSAVRRRVEVLAVPTLKLLEAAATVGECFWTPVLAEMVDLPEEELQKTLADAVASDWLRERRVSRIANTREYEFGHAVVRTVILSTLSKRQRTNLGQAAVRALARHPELDPTLLAGHFGRTGQADEGAHLYQQAAEDALALGQARTAVRLCEEGLRFVAQTDRITAAGLWDIKAQAALLEADWDGGRDAFDELSDLLDDPSDKAALFVRRAALAAASHRFEEARVEASEGGTAYREIGDAPGAARAELWIAKASESLGDLRRALRAFLRVHGGLPEDHEDHRRAVRGLARVLEASGDYENARARWKQSLARCRAARDARGVLRSELGLAEVTRLLGELDRAESIVADAQEGAYVMQDRLHLDCLLACIEAEREDFSSARRRMWRVHDRAKAGGADDVRRLAILRMAQWQRNEPSEPWDPQLVAALKLASEECVTAKPGLQTALELLVAEATVDDDRDAALAKAREIAEHFAERGAILAEEPPGLYLGVALIERRCGNQLESLKMMQRGLQSANAICKRLEREQREAYRSRWLLRSLGLSETGDASDTLSPSAD